MAERRPPAVMVSSAETRPEIASPMRARAPICSFIALMSSPGGDGGPAALGNVLGPWAASARAFNLASKLLWPSSNFTLMALSSNLSLLSCSTSLPCTFSNMLSVSLVNCSTLASAESHLVEVSCTAASRPLTRSMSLFTRLAFQWTDSATDWDHFSFFSTVE